MATVDRPEELVALVAGVLTGRVGELARQHVDVGGEALEVGGGEVDDEVVGDDPAALHPEDSRGVEGARDLAADLHGLEAAAERLAERPFHQPLKPPLEPLEPHWRSVPAGPVSASRVRWYVHPTVRLPLASGQRRAQLAVAVTLALVAGCVDAVSFDRLFDVFPANQSGNAVLLGIGIGGDTPGEVWRPAVAIAAFIAGVAAAVIIGDRVSPRRRPEILLAVEAVLLTALAIWLVVEDQPRRLGGATSGTLLVIAAVAMGIQTEVIGRVAGVTVATTYQSGAIARIGDAVGNRSVRDEESRRGVAPGLLVLGSVLVAYVGGAALGAALGDGDAAVIVPAVLVVAVAAATAFATTRTGRPLV